MNVTIGDSVISIGDYAFAYCNSIMAITIPSCVNRIADSAFYYCGGEIERIIVNEGNTSYHSQGNCLIETSTNTLMLGCDNSVIPDYITAIASFAFYGCNQLTNIVIPNNVISIDSFAFKYCTNLVNVTIGDGVTTIGYFAFEGCKKLTNVTIPNKVTTIGNYAFAECVNLVSVTLGENVCSIGNFAFASCYKLVEIYNKSSLTIAKGDSSVYTNGGIASYAMDVYASLDDISKISIDDDGFVIYKNGDNKILVGYLGTEIELVLPSDITEIYSYAFYDSIEIVSIVIPSNITKIGDSSFVGCRKLLEVYNESSLRRRISSKGDFIRDRYISSVAYFFFAVKTKFLHFLARNTSKLKTLASKFLTFRIIF